MKVRLSGATKWYWTICWRFVCPSVLACLVGSALYTKFQCSFFKESWEKSGKICQTFDHETPQILNWLINLFLLAITPVMAIQHIVKRWRHGGNVGLSALFQPSTSWRPNPFYNANSLTIVNSDEREDNKREGDKSGSNAMELLTFDNDPE